MARLFFSIWAGDFFRRFFDDRFGNLAVLFAFLLPCLVLAMGCFTDVANAFSLRQRLQGAADAAILAATADYQQDTDRSTLISKIETYLKLDSAGLGRLTSGPDLIDGKGLCITAGAEAQTAFMRLAQIDSVPVSVSACARAGQSGSIEISLVLDVSSSMIEDKRFTPMKKAVRSFLKKFTSGGKLADNVKVAIVPFSSRVNFGMPYKDWFIRYDNKEAIPKRWRDPQSYYTNMTFSKWIDDTTWLAQNSDNYYWMGCAEPRVDVEMRSNGTLGQESLDDRPPDVLPFVAMDSNAQSGTSFCPPPLTELTNDINLLTNAVNEMTSEGATRLDAGIIAGWYTLSPRWASAWSSGKPRNYGNDVKKYIIFMTDGEMNVKYGPSNTDKLDWICDKTRTKACNNLALNALQTICKGMKDAGITIFSVSYSPDADRTNLKQCASGEKYFFEASTSTIEAVYQQVASQVMGDTLRLTR
ncbi:hypothetical protein BJF92_05430 [Rhizobium rhizosphaerae]|uniref:VWFA domain-containing protein n=1 Tax=Xaviernesmea rhizosphaerae TaxID=1672749 RepID=A0A1Q9AFD8_9HYPH|nr:pilus assembly protein TadG-related protein [Xaviernesmea rhizosphaerae]OLP53596.1 hypothetical protein BJF92_05430 [Xaviernesmea rhizosphaerae]